MTLDFKQFSAGACASSWKRTNETGQSRVAAAAGSNPKGGLNYVSPRRHSNGIAFLSPGQLQKTGGN
jgi:hypothetical protein